jgi:hypothetical protein
VANRAQVLISAQAGTHCLQRPGDTRQRPLAAGARCDPHGLSGVPRCAGLPSLRSTGRSESIACARGTSVMRSSRRWGRTKKVCTASGPKRIIGGDTRDPTSGWASKFFVDFQSPFRLLLRTKPIQVQTVDREPLGDRMIIPAQERSLRPQSCRPVSLRSDVSCHRLPWTGRHVCAPLHASQLTRDDRSGCDRYRTERLLTAPIGGETWRNRTR